MFEEVNDEIEDSSDSINVWWYGRVEVGQCLFDRDANINARDSDRHTPQMSAVWQGHIEFARMVLERGTVIDAQDNLGQTALHFARKIWIHTGRAIVTGARCRCQCAR